MMELPQVMLKRGRERLIQEGHPWIFSGAVYGATEDAEPGCLVDVVNSKEEFVARGYFNPASRIPVRTLTRHPEQPIDVAFFAARIGRAYGMRQRWIDPDNTNAFRIVHGENDGLPGLIVDQYGDFLVVQFHTMGMEQLKPVVIEALLQVVRPRGIFERSDVGTRVPEGMDAFPAGPIWGEEPPEGVEIKENGNRFFVDIRSGQKTGFFLDQRENRLTVQALSKGAEVLNCFCYSGGFSVYAAQGQAARVTSVDISDKAIDLTRKNMALNGFDPEFHPCVEANVFDFLKLCRSEKRMFDLVVVDPPAFAKSQGSLKSATRAYISLNRKALGVLRPGGILVSASCSSLVDYEQFCTILRYAAVGAQRDLQIFKSHLLALDHPFTVTFPEGRYLKCFFGVAH